MPPRKMQHDVDPAKKILDEIGVLSDVKVMFSQVLVAIYQRPEMTQSGLILTPKTLDEDLYQGKAGLVLKLGQMAFEDTESIKFYGQRVNVGEWIAIRPSDGMTISINEVECRLVQDVHCKLVVASPDLVW